jgi:opacity protein-like surface antigen
MRRLMIGCFVIFLTVCVSAFCDELVPRSGWYVRADAGYSSARDPELSIPSGPLPADLGSSSLFGGGLGYSYVPGLRGDFTLTYRSSFQQISGFPAMPEGRADFKSLTALVSIYLDLISKVRFSPYIGFGIGMARNELGKVTIQNVDGSFLAAIDGRTTQNFAWQFCAGGSLVLQDHLLLDVGYHYLTAGDYESRDLLKFADGTTTLSKDRASFRAHEWIVSIQYTF